MFNVLRNLCLICCVLFCTDLQVIAQSLSADGFTKFNNIIEYKIYFSGTKQQLSDSTVMILRSTKIVGDTIIDVDSDEDAMMQPQLVIRPKDEQDINNILGKLSLGDSLILRYNGDSVFGTMPPPFYKNGDQVLQTLKVIQIFDNPAAYNVYYEIRQAEIAEKELATLKPDCKTIEAYAKKKGLAVKKMESGVYYIITRQGKGPKASFGKELVVKYTGSTLDGKVFDSNTNPKFNHLEPFKFNLGAGMVIPGWEDGLRMFNKGSKGILLIPSALAYGYRGNAKIKTNTILRFDVEVVDIRPAAVMPPDDKPLQVGEE
jgi:FKBP-type peptidyl-prolyl cis-trans isomerase FkpA